MGFDFLLPKLPIDYRWAFLIPYVFSALLYSQQSPTPYAPGIPAGGQNEKNGT
jgi:hypothetical protein